MLTWIISTAQQARPKVIHHSEPVRAQVNRSSVEVTRKPLSPTSALRSSKKPASGLVPDATGITPGLVPDATGIMSGLPPGAPGIAPGVRIDRKSVVQGKSVYVRVDTGGRRII